MLPHRFEVAEYTDYRDVATAIRTMVVRGAPAIGCAAALATIDVLTEPGFLDNVHARGNQLIDALREMQQLDESLRYVRGRGLMVATEFDSEQRARDIVEYCLSERRVILMTAGTRNRTIRWMPPLVVTSKEVNEAVQAFEAASRATG